MREWDDPIDRGGADRWPTGPGERPAYPPERPGHPARGSTRGNVETDLGSFTVGRGRADPPGHPTHGDAGRRGGHGRHRRPSRLPGPLALALTVAVLLGLFGVGAALLPPSLTSAPGDARPDQALDAAGPVQPPAADAVPEPATEVPTAAPEPTSRTSTAPPPSPTARVTAARTPSRTASSPARRTPSQTASRTEAAGDSREEQVLTIVNRERAANGCGAVVRNDDLTEAARLHSQDQGEHTNMSHTGSDGSTFVERARRAGYRSPIGENVAMGYSSPAAVMDGWMNSPGHRANILNCDARAMGVGVATGADDRLYWTQIFGSVA
ncbi:CAP domain-containing protein [Plantactinospora sp. CA-290183]|uniref:CAP domain-containing protein n=1 Tax=Plantactinospora sp. CA-290183 TaxID=3240006 RepID=UPI003D9121EB